jgi:alpha-tubulin suppressor-like RCC1 family protein
MIAVRPIGTWGDDLSQQMDVPSTASNLVAIAAGEFHSLGLDLNGAVIAWGKNQSGQATVPPEATNVVAVAGGSEHSVALRDDGTVIAWGANWGGQTNLPATATNVVAVSAGWSHSLALHADGTVVAWGDDTYGQCDVSFLADSVTAIASGYYHNLALKSDGTVVAWGLDNSVASAATNVIAIAAGSGHSLALRSDGTVVAWGDNSFGQTNVPAAATNVIAIAAGTFHSLALRADGTVIAWGSGYLSVTNVPAALTNVVAVAAGETHNLALVSTMPRFYRQLSSITSSAGGQVVLHANLSGGSPAFSYQWYKDGVAVTGATNLSLVLLNLDPSKAGGYTLVATGSFGQMTNQPIALYVQATPETFSGVGTWGDNYYGQCIVPLTVNGPRAIAAGGFHSLALNGDGTVTAWGKNNDGQTNVPPTVTNVLAIAAGGDHCLALRADGTVIGWGRSWDGQTNVPLAATNVVLIAAGYAHSVALRSNGTVLAWGNNDVDQTNVPTGLANVSRIACGYYHTLALLSNHTVVSWGLWSTVPAAATNVVAIAAGWGHSLALRADGTIAAWGDNSFGQSSVPPEATNVVALAAGFYHSLALRADGTVLAWGKGSHGVTNLPYGLGGVSAISAGEDYNLALRQLGPPQFQRSPDSFTVHVGGQAIFAGEAWGSQPLTFQWQRQAASVTGATNRFLLLDPTSATDAGNYVLTSSNSFGQASSASAALNVLRAPFVETKPIFTNVLIGQGVCLPATATGESPLTYQWSKNGVLLQDSGQINGSSSSTLCLTSTQFADGGDYQVILQNSFGSYTGLVTHLSPTLIIPWGDDFAGQLDMPPDIGQVVAVAGGSDHSLALRADGTVVAWGDNTFGQCTIPSGAMNVVAIAAYGSQSMALLGDGTVLDWGDNHYGLNNVPASATNVMAISTSDTHSIALRADGSTVAWGTGQGLAITSSTPAAASAIAAGTRYSMALASNNVTLYGLTETFPGGIAGIVAGQSNQMALDLFGNVTAFSILKSGGTTQLTVPPSINGIASIAAGQGHLLFLGTNGALQVMGDDTYGQTNVPPQATNVVAVAAGATHSLALLGIGRSALAGQTYARTAAVGDSVALVANSIGNAPASYQWQLAGTNLPGATSAALVLSPIRWSDAGRYRAIVSDAFGTATGPATDIGLVPPTLQLDSSSSGFVISSNSVQLRLLGASGTGSLILFASTNLVNWSPVLTNPPVRGAVTLTLPGSPGQPEMFYRVAETYGP